MTEARSKVIQGETSSPASDDSWDSLLMAMEERLTKRIKQTMLELFEGFQVSQQSDSDRRAPSLPEPPDGAGEASDRMRIDRPAPANHYEALTRYQTSTTNGNQYYSDRSTEMTVGYGETAREKTHNNLYGGMTKIGIILPRFDGSKVKDWLFKVDEFFAIVNTPIEMKVTICGKHFDGNAAKWHQTMMQSPYGKNLLNDWGFYKQLLKERFKDTGDDPILELKTLQETEGIVEYHKKFEKIRTRVNLPEEYLVSVYLEGLRMDTKQNIKKFRPQTLQRCLFLGRLYEQAHPKKSFSQDWGSAEIVQNNLQAANSKQDKELIHERESRLKTENVEMLDSISELATEHASELASTVKNCNSKVDNAIVQVTISVMEASLKEIVLKDFKTKMVEEDQQSVVAKDVYFDETENFEESVCDKLTTLDQKVFDGLFLRDHHKLYNRKKPKKLTKSWEVMKSGQTTEIQDLVHEDESHMVIGSDVKTYYSPQSQMVKLE